LAYSDENKEHFNLKKAGDMAHKRDKKFDSILYSIDNKIYFIRMISQKNQPQNKLLI